MHQFRLRISHLDNFITPRNCTLIADIFALTTFLTITSRIVGNPVVCQFQTTTAACGQTKHTTITQGIIDNNMNHPTNTTLADLSYL